MNSVQTPLRHLILIIDDERDIALSLQVALQFEGYAVDIFTDPHMALLNFRSFYYNLVLMDICMPGLSGFRVADKIRKMDSLVKICFMTGFEAYYRSLREFYPTLDFGCFIQKPVSVRRLIQIVKRQIQF